MNKAEELKPCPFCNKIPELKDYGQGIGSWMIICSCGATMSAHAKKAHSEPHIHNEIHDNMILAWNKREYAQQVSRENEKIAFIGGMGYVKPELRSMGYVKPGLKSENYKEDAFDEWKSNINKVSKSI